MDIILKHTVSYLLIIILGLFINNSSSNLHIHRLENGKIISHSHPYSKKTKHNHTHKQFDFLHSFHKVYAKISKVLFIDSIDAVELTVVLYSNYNYLLSGISVLDYSHSPPSFVLL